MSDNAVALTAEAPVRAPHLAPCWTTETRPRGGRNKGDKNSYHATLKRLLKTQAPDDAVSIVQKRFPDLKPRDLRDLMASIHICDATDVTADMSDRNSARKSLVGSMEAPPAQAPQIQVNIAVGRSLDSLSCAQADELPSPAPLLIEAKETPPGEGGRG